jgi:predicted ABC-type transport system involved in lysophospholipase L1 biosynthesis ATPase subunit
VLYPYDEEQQRSCTLDAQLLEIFKVSASHLLSPLLRLLNCVQFKVELMEVERSRHVSVQMVDLDEVLGRCGGWDSVKEWQDVLSGGEKQKLAMARLFFHKPKCYYAHPKHIVIVLTLGTCTPFLTSARAKSLCSARARCTSTPRI